MRGFFLLFLFLFPSLCLAEDPFWMKILDLRPTQMAVGMLVVNQKEAKIRRTPNLKMVEKLEAEPVPVVEGPNGELYLIDKHHLARALWQAGKKDIFVKVVWKWEGADPEEFWGEMTRREWVYLFDQFGNGPQPPERLPRDVRSLADDPHRSLAKFVRKAGGFKKVVGEIKKPFQEFIWAHFFRSRLSHKELATDLEGSIARALELAKSDEARDLNLPGYVGFDCKDVNAAAGDEI